ncbi:NADPH2:quinone reductase [Rhizobium sp. SG_E_25_P2]|uniref:quinone oxidoreductase family protein n=1 Tax=Rhizobium sp. SG_E_25_P2 TaxID=2879942 RepID=UPI002474AA8A|nr:quinone oxidoreductase [Rhizobium sp. SG_E_25_P2]MDH6267275.1 NADPH2:quinone reductase [Rhizobium sp. SG_E_25_P2]
MDRMVRLTAPGGTNMLTIVDCPVGDPGPGQIRIRQAAIGLNFIDIYHRRGQYPLAANAVIGVEAAGMVEALGEGVDTLSVGDRIAYAGEIGAYAATRLLPAWRAVRLPDSVSFEAAAGALLRALTVHMLFRRVYPVSAESTVLVHAAAGGLGGMATRWARHLGATVIGVVGSEDKAEIARRHGALHVIIGRDADLESEVAALTCGNGVDFAIDGIGGATLAKTLKTVKRFGVVASVGEAAGSIPPVSVYELGPRRSISLARPSVMAYAAHERDYTTAAEDCLQMIGSGALGTDPARYRLEDVSRAHDDLEGGVLQGSAVLIA